MNMIKLSRFDVLAINIGESSGEWFGVPFKSNVYKNPEHGEDDFSNAKFMYFPDIDHLYISPKGGENGSVGIWGPHHIDISKVARNHEKGNGFDLRDFDRNVISGIVGDHRGGGNHISYSGTMPLSHHRGKGVEELAKDPMIGKMLGKLQNAGIDIHSLYHKFD
jgi:hypothetical protein